MVPQSPLVAINVVPKQALIAVSGCFDCGPLQLGPLNATIHKMDEYVPVIDLDTLSRIYEQVISLLLR
jgi:acetylornithine deacetylase/succinyl-diaminopimelate desuccinylase-like protein